MTQAHIEVLARQQYERDHPGKAWTEVLARSDQGYHGYTYTRDRYLANAAADIALYRSLVAEPSDAAVEAGARAIWGDHATEPPGDTFIEARAAYRAMHEANA